MYIMTGKNLRRIRQRLEMTQSEMGIAIGMRKNSVARMERGEMPIRKTTVMAVRYLLVMKSKKGGR